MEIKLYTDGGARGNPGPSAAGVVIKDSKNAVLKEIGKFLGACTNNEAEYKALVIGLTAVKNLGYKKLSCFLDSELIVKQLNGEYRVKNKRLRKFFDQVKDLENSFEHVTYKHVKRNRNKQADSLVNEVLDSVS